MDAATQNVFAPVQVFPQGNTLQPVTIQGQGNVFFGARFALPETGQSFNSFGNTYVGVSGLDTPRLGAVPFQGTGEENSVVVSNNYQLPPVGYANVVVGNDVCCEFGSTSNNVLIAPFTPRSITGSNVPVDWQGDQTVCIGYPDVRLFQSSNSVLVNSATPLPSGEAVSVGNVVFNILTLTTAEESDFLKAGVPVKGLYYNANTSELRIRLL